jgi:hypothetical protein
MKKKQTAVEFYRTELSALVSMKESKFQTENEIFERAKQMEEQQIIDAHIHAQFKVIEAKREFAQKYFNDFYGGNNE